ncbi:hypothetical protein ACQ4PT_030351 [Festuca glaucescens]
MVHGRLSGGRGGGQRSRGESSNGGGCRHEKTEAEKMASDTACLHGSYRYLNYGRKPPPTFLRPESTRGLAALHASSSRRTTSLSAQSSSPASTSRAPPQLQMEIDSDHPVLEYAGDYVDEAEFTDIVDLDPNERVTATSSATPPTSPPRHWLQRAQFCYEGAENRRFSLQVDMQCRCMGCVGKVEKAMASIGTFRGVERSVGDVDTGVVAVAGKVNPTEVSQRKTRKDVKIFCPDPPVENHKQVCIPPLLGLNEGHYCDVLDFTNDWKMARRIMRDVCLAD